MMYDNKERKSCLYELKKRASKPLTWYKNLDSFFDTVTGNTKYSWEIYQVRRAIVLPTNLDRAFKFSLSYLAANKNFIYGGEFDKEIVNIIIDLRDLPKAFQERDACKDDKVIMDGKVFQISNFEIVDDLTYAVELKHIRGQSPEAMHSEFTQNDLGGKNVWISPKMG